jgi:molecular chaperone HtpG
MESHRFEADVRQILHLVTHSLYSDREIFLRELVSNASDALDRARFEGLKNEDLLDVEGEPGISVSVDADAGTITISDDGIGMTQEQVVEHLGTIAKSGTKAFAEALKAKGENAEGLIGQFGVGFYSAFMVADKVTVDTRSGIPGSEPVLWVSDGGEAYEMSPGTREGRGTTVTLHLREDAAEFMDEDRLRDIIGKHSDFVAWPVTIGEERVNQEAAIWTRNPSEVTDDEYKAFYRHISNDWQEPLAWLHVKLEGTVSFNAVLFLPKSRPWEMDRLDFKVGLKLYQKRVMILEHADQLLPRNLRFVTGVVDAPDVSLNVSREMLQQTPLVESIKKQLTKRILKKLEEVARTSPEEYDKAWGEYGHILKEGIAEDDRQRKQLTNLLRYTTTTSDGALRSLGQVKADLGEGQDTIWYYTSVDKERIGQAPVLEGFKKRDLEVVLMSDPVDEWVVMQVKDIDGTKLQSVMTGELPEDEGEDADPVAEAAKKNAAPLVTWMKGMFGGAVADVRVSTRLTDSPSVLVDAEGGVSSNMERILKAANQTVPASQRVLEVNPEHPMVKTLAKLNAEGASGIEPFARLLLDHAAISEGRLDDPEGFASRLQVLMERAAAGMGTGDGTPEAPLEPEIVTPA